MAAAAARIPDQAAPIVYKNNSDGKGNSYGCHENYMMDRAVPFARVIEGVVPHFVSRTIFTGSGKVGVETPALDADTVHYQISQRAEFFEEIVGLETTLKRPIVNTRDEPHADPTRFRRLHVIVGDANLSEIAILLKVGTTAVVLAMIEDDAGPTRSLSLADPVRALHQVSADLSLSRALALTDGSSATALEMQWELFGAARKYAEEHGLGALGDDGTVGALVLEHWEAVLEGLESDPAALSDTLDWVAKQQLLLAYQDRHGCGWGDPRVAALALQYHDLRPDRSVYQRLGLRRLLVPGEAERAVSEPPPGTRAWFRGKCLARWPEAVVTANWDSLVFDIGTDPLRRVPMMDPLKGTAEHTGALLAQSTGPADLLERLNS
jgi:proteasome accessory factor A